MMKTVPQLSTRLAYMLTLGLLIGLVGCTGVGYSVDAVPGSPSGEAPLAGNTPPGNASPGNISPGNTSAGNPLEGNPAVGNGPVSNRPSGEPLTPGAPYPMPQPNMPAGILGFVPADGGQVCPTPRVALALHLTDAMRKSGAFDTSTVTLTLDGKDILSEIQLIAPMIYPQNQVTLTYAQSTPLVLGAHQIIFTYPSSNGPITLTLNFTVANIACQ